ELKFDDKFYNSVLSAYFTNLGRLESDKAASNYESYFPETEPLGDDDDAIDKAVEQFDKAFEPEFGFSVHLLFKVRREFRKMAVTSKHAGGVMDEDLMLQFLSLCNFSQKQSQAFLECFTLPIRKSGGEGLLAGCLKQ